jgi:hypothetical protein
VKAGIFAVANCTPNECSAIQTAFDKGDHDAARELYFRIFPVNTAVTATFVGTNVAEAVKSGKLPKAYSEYGDQMEQIFITFSELKDRFGSDFDRLPPGAIGVYTYFERLKQGLQQFMCGARKFTLDHITREDIAALTQEAAGISGIRYIMDVDKEEVDRILG